MNLEWRNGSYCLRESRGPEFKSGHVCDSSPACGLIPQHHYLIHSPISQKWPIICWKGYIIRNYPTLQLPTQPQLKGYCILPSTTFLRALDKKYLMIIQDNFSYFSIKPYLVTPHLNCFFKVVQMKGHNIWFSPELTKIIPDYHQMLLLI